ncbi:SKI8 subunit of superkiller complex protein [Octopus bimaculoides]|uniref:SKI8 subunit of superkiller complex protein n=1 Tax=Octopus bimaculoides TaxID=37653 RepID=UPI0022E41B75|nr:SKI8 subunit of superkiller complex protein [Octopus bimaculoides]
MSRRRLENGIRSKMNLTGNTQGFSEVKILHNIPYSTEMGAAYSLQFSFDGKVLAAGFEYGGIQLYSTETGRLLNQLRNSRLSSDAVMCLRFNPENDTSVLATTADGQVITAETEEGILVESIEEKNNQTNAVDFCLDGQVFATGGADFAVRLYDSRTMQILQTYGGENSPDREEYCTNRIYSLKFSPEYNDIFITGGWDKSIKIFDKRTKLGVRRYMAGPHICGEGLDFRPGKILSASWVSQNGLQIWDYCDGMVDKTVPFENANGQYLYCAQFCDHDVVLAGGSGTHNVQAIHYPTGKCIGKVQMAKPVYCLDSVFGGQMFAVGSSQKSIIIASLV